MKNQGFTPLLLLVALSAALLPRQAATPSYQQPSKAATADTALDKESQYNKTDEECTDCLDEPIRLYREFSGRTPQPPPSPDLAVVGETINETKYDRRFTIFRKRRDDETSQAPLQANLEAIKNKVHLAGYRSEFIIALVPDPLDSSLAELFDGGIRGIGKAMASSGYLLDRLWLPWEKTADKENAHRRSPGVLLFRTPNRHLLSVLLVGETPKQGIHKDAFHQALRLVRALSDEANAPLRVLGPTFSGSAESIRIALQEDPLAHEQRFTLISGTATAADLSNPGAFGPSVKFCRSVPSDSKLTSVAFKFLLKGLGWRCRQLALLTESDTAFGTSASPILARNFCQQDDEPRSRPILISFPSGLAEVRTAREESGGAVTDPKPDRPSITVPQSSLALSLAEKRRAVDVIQGQSPLTARADELVLANLFTTMSHEDIRYVGILGTDVRDELFLATRIRRVAPDVILFAFHSDLLQAHPQYSADLDGLMVVTSAPLVTESPRWRPLVGGPNVPVLLHFGSKFEKGTYLAVRRLTVLTNPEAGSDEVEGERRAWVSVVGNGALWPIFQQPVYASAEDAKRDGACYASELFQPPPPASPAPSFLLYRLQPDLALIVPLLVLFFGARWMGRTAARLETSPVPIYPSLADWTSGSAGAGRLWICGFAVFWTLGAAVMFVGALPIEQRRSLWLAAWGALFSAALWATAQPAWPHLRRWPHTCVAALGGALLILMASAILFRLWIPKSPAAPTTQNFLFNFRARFLTSGLSPLVSLGCLGAGFLVWVGAEIKRRTLVRRQWIAWPIPPAGDPALQPCGRLAEPIASILRSAPGATGRGVRSGFWPTWITLLAISAWLLLRRVQPIAESRFYGIAFVLLIFLLATLAAASFVQFFTLWRALDALLDRLQHSHLLPVFHRISDEVLWNPLRSFGRRVPKARLLLLSVSKLRPAVRSELAPLLAEILGSKDIGPLTQELAARREVNEILAMCCVSSAEVIGDPRVQELFAIRVIAYLRCVVVHLRSSLVGAFAPSLLLLAAVRTYAFAPQQEVSLILWGTLLAIAALTLWVFVQMDRDDVLSAIAGTEGGQITFDRHFFWNVLVYGAVPVVTVVVGQFPQIGRFVVGWLNPLLRATGGP